MLPADYITLKTISAFSAGADFWFSLRPAAQTGVAISAFFLIAIYFIASYFLSKISELKKEKLANAKLLEKQEKKIEDAGREKNRILAVVSALDWGVVAFDENGKVFMANKSASEMLGVKSRPLNGMHYSELALLKDVRPVAHYFEPFHNVDKKEIDLGKITVEFSALKLALGDGKNGKLILMRDLTKEKSFQKIKNEFLLSMAHQLKTSISSVRWLVKMFMHGDFGKISKEQKVFVSKLLDKNEFLMPLANNLLSAIKIEEGRFGYHKTSVSIVELAQQEIADFKDQIKKKKIKLQFKSPPEGAPYIKADREKIASVMQTLFDNAIKYTPEKGSVRVSLSAGKKEIEFKIADSGIGIPEVQHSEIFKQFFRAKNAALADRDGSGIGLFLAKKIIEDHGGRMGFESEENRGATFYFALPIE